MDAADILGAPRPQEGAFKARARDRPSAHSSEVKGLKGLQKEVYHLTGKSHEEVTKPETPPSQRFGNAKKRGTLRKVHWEFVGFSNSARKDGLMLRHWQKKGIKWEDYPFARFNKTVQLLCYSDDEYERLLHSEQWTKEKTDTLMSLVQRFHLNFILVQDRWSEHGVGMGAVSVESLKERFYEIQRKLHQSRELPPLPDDNPLLSKPFNRQWEEERKQSLLTAMLDKDAEEVEILEKAKKIEAVLKRKRMAERSAGSKAGNRQGGAQAKTIPAVGGVALRSSMLERGMHEPKNAAAILDSIGFQLPVSCRDPEVCTAVDALLSDVNALLQLYQQVEEHGAKKAKRS